MPAQTVSWRYNRLIVDAILTDDAILYGFLAQDPHTKLLPGNITDEPYGLAIAKNHPEFVRFVNAVLEQMHSRWPMDQDLEEMVREWPSRWSVEPRRLSSRCACYTDDEEVLTAP